MELLEQTKLEYEGEGASCQVVLGSLGKGLEESLSLGPAQAFWEVIAAPLCLGWGGGGEGW